MGITRAGTAKILTILILVVLAAGGSKLAYSLQTQDSLRDGNIPSIDVQMVAQKRWLVSSREFQNLQKELSYFIDKELEKEKKRLMEKENERFRGIEKSFVQLVPNSRTKFRTKDEQPVQ